MRNLPLAVGLLAGQAVLLLILAFALPSDRKSTRIPITLPDVVNGQFAAKGSGVTWGACGLPNADPQNTYYRTVGSDVICVSPLSGVSETVINGSTVVGPTGDSLTYSSVILSGDGKQALLAAGYEKIWRHSYLATHYIIPVPYNGEKAVPIASDALSPQRFASWSPASSGPAAGRVAFVHGCNLYMAKMDFSSSSSSASNAPTLVAITTNGLPGSSIGGVDSELCYGVPDWVYEEEVLATADAAWWSPDGQHIAFLRSNDAAVPLTHITRERITPEKNPYPELLSYRMPKPGFPNPIVDVLVYSFVDGKTEIVDLQATTLATAVGNNAKAEDYIVGRVEWASTSKLVVRVFNRLQNHEQLVVQAIAEDGNTPAVTPASVVVLARKAAHGWLDFEPALQFLPAGATGDSNDEGVSFAAVENVNGHNHLVLYKIDAAWDKATRTQVLTSGDWDVTGVTGYSKALGSLVFTSTVDGPTRNVVSAVSVRAAQSEVIFRDGYTTITMSASGELAVVGVVGPSVPTYSLIRFDSSSSAPNVKHSVLSVLQDNSALATKLGQYAMPEKRFTKIRVDQDRVFDSYIIVPDNFDDSGRTKYPVLFKVYNGPGSQGVLETFGISFDQYLASIGIVVVQCDGRGTTGRGLKWRHETYMNLGVFEPADQIDAAAALAKEHSWVDAKRMSIWGWSYGGYVTARVAGSDTNNVFKVKMSVAPVTDWRFYDSVYTERYMGLPKDNANYATSSVMTGIQNFDPSFLLVHGLADDNVQYINSAALEEALIANNKHYTTRFYPNRDHGITGGFTRENLYSYLVEHLVRYLL